MAADYPKVLIIGQSFDKKSGSGITLTNLFYGWDKNCIAVAAADIQNADFSVCENFYCIGDQEIVRDFPFNLKLSEEDFKSGKLPENNRIDDVSIHQKGNVGKLTKIKDDLIMATGQIHRRRRFIAGKAFMEWVNAFSPDVIYSQLSSLELIRFVDLLQNQLNKPLAFHMMDNWPDTIVNAQNGIFKIYWKRKIDKSLRNLFNKASVLMSISEAMSDEYSKRFGASFVPFHNPIDVEKWTSVSKTDYSVKGKFKILYAGRIGTGLQNSLFEVAEAIKSLIEKGLDIEFQIQSTNASPLLQQMAKYDFVVVRPMAAYQDLPKIFASADLLLLPNDFDQKSISFLIYSMPTKASEYMASGTPILSYSSEATAVTKHALKYGWAFVVSDNSGNQLRNAIQTLYEDQNFRKELGTHAKSFAVENYNSEIVREKFKKQLSINN